MLDDGTPDDETPDLAIPVAGMQPDVRLEDPEAGRVNAVTPRSGGRLVT